MKQIRTIGHSTHPLEVFMEMLKAYQIDILADVRRFPGSAKYPWFNKEPFAVSLKAEGITYLHFESLGGRRKVSANSPNVMWRNKSFRGYADYTQTAEFNKALKELESITETKKVAYMCSEAVWWRCHRSLISDVLTHKGWQVNHIFSATKSTKHTMSDMYLKMQQTGMNFDKPDLI